MNATDDPIKSDILLVDDRPQNLLALEAILEPLGQRLVRANSGEEALKCLLRSDFAVILLDVQMPGIDGFETARLIKERERSRHIPIIFLTAISKDEQFVFKGYTVGAVDYISKPFDPDILRSKVAVFVDLFKKTEQLRRQAEMLQLSERREREREVDELKRAGERRYKQLAESMPQIVWTAATDGTYTYFNQRWFDFSGLSLAESTRLGLAHLLHADDYVAYTENWARAVREGEDFEGMYRFKRAGDGAYRWHLVRAIAVRDENDKIASWIGTSTDIDDRKRGEEALSLLAEASTALTSSLDYRRALADVGRLTVPAIADWCLFEVLEDDGSVRRVAAVHQDAEKAELLRDMAARFPYDPEADTHSERVFRTGRAVRIDVVGDEDLAGLAASAGQLDALRGLGIGSYMCVPLLARGRSLGTMTFVTTEEGRSFSEADLTLAEDLARRAALAVDNAQLYEVAQRERERLAEANRAKDEFLAIVSHELRTPLNSMLGWTQLLRTGKLDDALFERAMETIERKAKSQAQLINDLLDVSRIITGKLRLKVGTVDPAAIVHSALDSVRPAIKAKGIELTTDLDETVVAVSGDPDRLQQVVWNLLSNAIKFTPAGGRIDVSMRRDGDDVVIAVADSGLGIRRDFLPYVFDRFRQADASSTRSFGGLGIGLSIVRNLVELHGGDVRAESEGEGKGATFVVRLPVGVAREVDEVEVRDAGAIEPSGSGRELAGLSILLVEDEEDGKEVLKLTLDRFGAVTRAVSSAAEALAAFEAHPPDVLLSDIGLPGASGYELIRQVRERGAVRGGDIPAVAVTAFASEKDRARALAAGFDRHVAKPVDPADLISIIRGLVAGRRRPPATRESAGSVE
jgi:PAS domain S-box-containing protein